MKAIQIHDCFQIIACVKMWKSIEIYDIGNKLNVLIIIRNIPKALIKKKHTSFGLFKT